MAVSNVQDLILAISKLPSGSRVIDHLKSVKYQLADRVVPIVKTSGSAKRQIISRSMPQVHVQNNSVQAIQQAIDEMLKHIGRATYTGK